jgi:hypothetical protein
MGFFIVSRGTDPAGIIIPKAKQFSFKLFLGFAFQWAQLG